MKIISNNVCKYAASFKDKAHILVTKLLKQSSLLFLAAY